MARRRRRQRVIATVHAQLRWEERANRPAKKLNCLMTMMLNDQLGAGIPVRNGQPLLNMSAERLGLKIDLEVPMELPGTDGVWKAVTVKPKGA